jgi:1-acyl-sn-glycerol-3-phosphate acyltransferase
MQFDPKTKKYPYPKITDKHYITIKKNDGTVFDGEYPYIDKSKKTSFLKFWVRVLLYIIVFPMTKIRLGLKINGKENLKKNKDIIKNGVISCSNHVHFWDYLAIMSAIKPIKPNVVVWAPNIRGETGKLMRLVGGIPIPDDSTSGTMTFIKETSDMIENGGWLQIYAEGSMWEYYKPIRPFKKGLGFFACKTNRPVLPMAFSYREPNFIRKNIFKQIACFNLNIGEPIFPDESLPKKDREIDLVKKSHQAVCNLAGINPKENLYPPIFDNTERVDYY